MFATIARPGGPVQLEYSDMRMALNMAKMAKGGFSRAAIEETQFLFKEPQAKVWEEKKRGVEFPGHDNVMAANERHPAMLREHQTEGCLPCQSGTCTESPDMLETPTHGCISTRATQTADTRTDATST